MLDVESFYRTPTDSGAEHGVRTQGEPCRLWSLWDIMNRFQAGRLVRSLFWIELWICRCKRKEGIVTTRYDKVLARVEEARDVCADAGFNDAALQIQMLFQRLKADVPRENHDVIAHMLRSVHQQFLLATSQHYFLRLDLKRVSDYSKPLDMFGDAAVKFQGAQVAMAGASRCFALDEWDACVYQAMRVLEHGLRWLAAQINAGPFPLTLSKPIELECWENIIGNIQARINDELGPPPPGTPPRAKKTAARDEELAFYAKAASELRYFKDAWRNHVMHDRHDPYDEPEAALVLGHVASFMRTLAVRA